jgi:hypothetical protein
MASSRQDRASWEYADGPRVGEDIPITSEPRKEATPGGRSDASAPGQPANGSVPTGAQSAEAGEPQLEEREVRADDPELSTETNQRLTTELREVIGRERVRVPADRPHASRGEHPQQQGFISELNQHRFQLIRGFAITLTFAAIVALASGDWWILPLAAGVHALGTMTVTLTIFRMVTVSEHPSPEVAAALADEGVSNPDEHFSRMIEEFRGEPERGASEVLSPGFNERTSEAGQDAGAASAEQSSAMTPTAGPSQPAGEGAAPDYIIWTTVGSLLVLSVVLPAVMGGGWMWLLTAVMVPLLAGWVLLQRAMATRGAQMHLGRGAEVTIVACTAVAVAVFCAIVALAFQH